MQITELVHSEWLCTELASSLRQSKRKIMAVVMLLWCAPILEGVIYTIILVIGM